jgi:hypothetical protein
MRAGGNFFGGLAQSWIITRARPAWRSFIDIELPDRRATRYSFRRFANLKPARSLAFDDNLAVQRGFSTTAMAAGVTDTLWSLDDMVGIVDEWEARQKDRQS